MTLMPALAQDSGSDAAASFIRNNVAAKVQSGVANKLESLFDNLEVTITGLESAKPAYNVVKIKPLVDNQTDGTVVFLQLSANRTADRNTANVGLGYRKLIADRKIIVGLNGFYDNEWSHKHERASAGLELLSSVGDIRYNQYWALSDLQSRKIGVAERALDGYDFELALPLPYLPLTKLHAKTFKYDGNDSVKEIKGETLSLRSALPFGFTFEAGITSYDDATPEQDFISLSYNTTFGDDGAKANLVSDSAYRLYPIEDRRFEKVRRSNIITKEVGGVGGSAIVIVTGV
jgi:hypothetical protein